MNDELTHGDDTFDFGFSAITLDELDVLQETTAKLEESDAETATVQARLDKMYSSIQPLLNNLHEYTNGT